MKPWAWRRRRCCREMIRNQTDTIVIKPKISPIFRLLLIVVPALLFVAGVAGAYFYGYRTGSAELESSLDTVADLTDRYEFINTRYTEAQDSLVQLKRQLSIDESAYARLRSELEQSYDQLSEMTGELKFYRSIISPQEGKNGVSVQEIVIEPTDRPGMFRFKLVLIQTLQKGKELSGTVRLSIKGESNGEIRVVEHPDKGQEKLPVKFKYFQSLTGAFDLPESFVPLEVRVNLSANKKKSLIDEKWYPWSDIVAAQAS